jgi:putative ABC transport system permease protein
MSDLRLALRKLLKSPGFTIIAVLTLALGIGANTAIFSVVYSVVLRPLPYPDQEQLVTLSEWSEQVPGMSISYPNYLDWSTRQSCFSALGVSRRQSVNYESPDGAERLRGLVASRQLFDVLGLPILRGRVFTADEDKPGAERTAILSERFWKRSFGGRDTIVGERVRLSGELYTIVGIAPDAVLDVNGECDVALPLGLWGLQYKNRWDHPGLYGLARLKPGVSLEAAQKEMKALAQSLAREYPETNTGNSIEMRSFAEQQLGSLRTALWLLLGAAALVLMIACANVANLQLARVQARAREFAIRAALGSGRGRIVRQLLAESLTLGLLGCIAGIVLGGWALAAMKVILPTSLPRIDELSLNGWVLAFSLGMGLATSLVFGLAPAGFASGTDLRSAFAAGTGTAGSVKGRRWRFGLIVGEFALTSLLLVGSCLMLRTLAKLQEAKLGFATERVMTFDFELAGSDYKQSSVRLPVIEQALERIAMLPGVRKVAVIDPLPLRGGNQSTYYVEGMQVAERGRAAVAERGQVSGSYFATMDIPLVAGRSFDAGDRSTSRRVAIVDTLFVEKYFPGQNPLGKRFVYGEKPPSKDSDWFEIVGVVGHIKNFGIRSSTREQTYIPVTQSTPQSLSFAVRTERDTTALAKDLRSLMGQIAPNQPLFGFRTMDDRFRSSISTERLTLLLLGCFAILALLLASVGLYGVLSYTVGQRTREIGVRMALGATAGSVVSLILGQGLRLAGLGLALGLVGALWLTRLLQSFLYEVSPFDLLSFAAVALVLAGIGILACWLPARRATLVNPIDALRSE